MSIRNIINKLKSIQQFDVEKETIDIINENKEFILYLLRNQMATGIDGDGNLVRAKYGTFYSDRTVREKEGAYAFGLGRETNVVTNYMTGQFYDSIQLASSGTDFVFSAGVPYYEEILLRSGKQIMKLNAESSKELLNAVIFPQLEIRREKYSNGLQ